MRYGPLSACAAALIAFMSPAAALAAPVANGDTVTFRVEEFGIDVPAIIGVPDASAPNTHDGLHPVMFLMHGCGGLGTYARPPMIEEASWYRERGFVTVLPDDFTPRKEFDVCNTQSVGPEDRAADLHAIAARLPALEGVGADPARMFAAGYSHGGAAVIAAAVGQNSRPDGEPRLKAVFSYYPNCANYVWAGALDAAPAIVTIMVGAKDPLASPESCPQAVALADDPEHVHLWIYPRAVHAFNFRIDDHRAFGQAAKGRLWNAALAYDEQAATAARGVVRDQLRALGIEMP